MIAGQLKHAMRYTAVHPRLQKAFEFLMTQDLESLAPGAYPIDGVNIVALVQEYTTAAPDVAEWETHDYHMDVQYLVRGKERIGYGRRDGTIPVKPYNKLNDYDIIEPIQGNYYTLEKDGFMVLFPEDAHQPRVFADAPQAVKKICIKVLV
ncbi:YhcH/YjgK/YiaL family protein [Uliginosibacterium sp. sgz301328]|uniref:YhcH/YjgK/YiaL family protein n=1 Tax=Uliginosibacterium sp. sgz301328 TaxID=3243764 RepID=UPI00359E7E40